MLYPLGRRQLKEEGRWNEWSRGKSKFQATAVEETLIAKSQWKKKNSG